MKRIIDNIVNLILGRELHRADISFYSSLNNLYESTISGNKKLNILIMFPYLILRVIWELVQCFCLIMMITKKFFLEDMKMKKDFLASMQFSHEEAAAETPVSACGVTLGVATTVRLVCALGVNNYINFVKGKGIKKLMIIDGFAPDLLAF